MTDKPKHDFIVPLFRNSEGLHGIRCQEDAEGHRRTDAALLTPLDPNKPQLAEIVRVKRRRGNPLMDVETVAFPFKKGKGPARVASPKYREGWERIFGETVH